MIAEPNKEKLKQMALVLLKEFGSGKMILSMAGKEIDKRVDEERAKVILIWLHNNLKEYCGT